MAKGLQKLAQIYSNHKENSAQLEPFLNQIKTHKDISLNDIIRYALENDEFATLMKSATLEPYWEERIKQFTINHCANNFAFIKQPHLSLFEQTAGLFMYNKAKLHLKRKEEVGVTQCFNLSLTFHCFHTASYLMCSLQDEIKKFQANHRPSLQPILQCSELIDKLNTLLLKIKLIAKYHGTPGYLLLAIGYLWKDELSITQDGYNKDPNSNLFKAYKYLKIAQALEVFSTESIYNNYYGKGILASNTFGIDNIEEATNSLLGKLQMNGEKQEEIQQAIDYAINEYNIEIKQSFYTFNVH